jgi:serine/threonine-protein kinase
MKNYSQITADWLESEFPDLNCIQPLSQGGQKQVFSAQHPHDGDVVLKLMSPNADMETTQREILAVAQVKSTRIPKILANGKIDTQIGACFWFREQRILGLTVRQQLASGPFDVPLLLRLALHISETLAAAEDVNIVHRDVKPDNIILDQLGDFWLIDFGLARHLDLESLTNTANFFGKMTCGYAPPEQFRNLKPQIDARADLFALGVTLYECATGTNPFHIDARDPHEVLQRVEKDSLPRLKLSFPSSTEFSDLIATLTQRQRVHRPQTAKEAYTWVKEICNRERVQ